MEKRWNVTLTHESPEHRDVHAFIWGYTLEDAERRLKEGQEIFPDVWEGWTFTVSEETQS